MPSRSKVNLIFTYTLVRQSRHVPDGYQCRHSWQMGRLSANHGIAKQTAPHGTTRCVAMEAPRRTWSEPLSHLGTDTEHQRYMGSQRDI